MSQPRVFHLVLTGGPCAGKTSVLAHLSSVLGTHGWRVLTVPEAATLLIAGGIDDIGFLATSNRDGYLAVQQQLVGLQRDLRDRYDALANTLGADRVLVIHDRGIADNRAYMTEAEYAAVLRAALVVDGDDYQLYDGVLHLRSAAVPAAGYDGSGYTTQNNAARRETAAAAAELDQRTLDGWVGHPHLMVVGSAETFAEKMHLAASTVLHMVGVPESVEIERKFLLAGPPDLTHPVLAAAQRVDIRQVYLPRVGEVEHRVRSRTLAGVTTYTHATKRDDGAGGRIEVETSIDQATFGLLASLRDPDTAEVRKTRYIFVDGDLRFELDEFHDPAGAWLLEVELTDAAQRVEPPAFLPIDREVTDDPAWRNRALAETAAR